MKLLWDALTFDELELLAKKSNRNHIALAICLKYYQYFGSFPTGPNEVAEIPLQYIVDQLGITIATYHNYDWNDRLARYHRQEILDFLGVRKFSEEDRSKMQEWLTEFIFPNGSPIEESVEYVYEWLHHKKIARPAEKQLGRELSSAYNHFEKELYENLGYDLPLESKYLVDYCLEDNKETISFSSLKSDPGRISQTLKN